MVSMRDDLCPQRRANTQRDSMKAWRQTVEEVFRIRITGGGAEGNRPLSWRAGLRALVAGL